MVPTKVLILRFCFEGFEDELELPAFPVDPGDSGGAEVQDVGEQADRALILLVPDDNAAKRAGELLTGSKLYGSSENLIGEDVAVLRQLSFGRSDQLQVRLGSRHSHDSGAGPVGQQVEVDVAAVQNHDGTGRKLELTAAADIRLLSFGDQ